MKRNSITDGASRLSKATEEESEQEYRQKRKSDDLHPEDLVKQGEITETEAAQMMYEKGLEGKGLYEQLQESEANKVEYSKEAARRILGIAPTKPGNELGVFFVIDINALKARNFSVEEFLKVYESTGFQMITPVEPNIQLLDNAKSETYDAVTAVVRRADVRHKLAGGGSRHYVRDILLPLLEEAGIRLCRVNQKQNESPKQETLY